MDHDNHNAPSQPGRRSHRNYAPRSRMNPADEQRGIFDDDLDRMADSPRDGSAGPSGGACRPSLGFLHPDDTRAFLKLISDDKLPETTLVDWLAERAVVVTPEFLRRCRDDLHQRLVDLTQAAHVASTITGFCEDRSVTVISPLVSLLEQKLTQWIFDLIRDEHREMTGERWIEILKAVNLLIRNRAEFEKLRAKADKGISKMSEEITVRRCKAMSAALIAERVREALSAPRPGRGFGHISPLEAAERIWTKIKTADGAEKPPEANPREQTQDSSRSSTASATTVTPAGMPSPEDQAQTTVDVDTSHSVVTPPSGDEGNPTGN